MITPRHFRLFPTPGLKAFQQTIVALAGTDPWTVRRTAVIVPTGAAATQLRHTIESSTAAGAHGPVVRVLPLLLTREGWYREMHHRIGEAPHLLSPVERHVAMLAAARQATRDGVPPPFKLRSGLIPAVVDLYDELMRHRRSVDAFERLMTADLEPSLELDRGARRLLRQTAFLASTFRRYETSLAERARLDEHGLRRLLMVREPIDPLMRVVVTVPDHIGDPAGLWPADFDLLTRLPNLDHVDVVATDRTLGAGLYDRLVDLLPGIVPQPGGPATEGLPVVVTPEEEGPLHSVWRDREEELLAVIRSLKSDQDPAVAPDAPRPQAGWAPARRVGVVFRRRLPYLYLAQQLFNQSGVPFETLDALPLAAEPYAAALDLVCSFVISNYDRVSTVALLRSPHFRFELDGQRLDDRSVSLLDRLLQDERFSGGRPALARLTSGSEGLGRPGASDSRSEAQATVRCVARLAEALSPLENDAPPSDLLEILGGFLKRHVTATPGVDAFEERERRARKAVWAAIDDLARAHRELDDSPTSFSEVVSALRRWIESQVFEPRAGAGGVQLVDAQAAPYGRFHDLFVIGLVDGEWPESLGRNIFYPSSLLIPLGWPRERDLLQTARAAFGDLVGLSEDKVWLSTVSLEDDAVVTPSSLLEEVSAIGMVRETSSVDPRTCVTREGAMAFAFAEPGDFPEPTKTWLAARIQGSDWSAERFRGRVGRRAPVTYAVRSLEEYLECPFKYLANRVLRLGREDDGEGAQAAQRRGLLLHRVFEIFFRDWRGDGNRSITSANLDQALSMFTRLADVALEALSPDDRAVTRSWLLGSAAASGLAERLFVLEVRRPADIVERLTEFRVDGEFLLGAGKLQRKVHLRGVADRVDLFSDGTFRVLDYKSNRAPDRSRSLQLPLYARCLEQQLEPHDGQPWRVSEAAFAAFGDPRFYVPLGTRPLTRHIDGGEEKALAVLNDIEQGDYPVRPAELFRCSYCAYPTVCRKDYVGDE